MSFEILQALFSFGKQAIKQRAARSAAATVDPFAIGFTQFFINSSMHEPKISGSKPTANGVAMRGVQTLMQALPIF